MTNLFLSLNLLTNLNIGELKVYNSSPDHIYQIQQTVSLTDTNTWINASPFITSPFGSNFYWFVDKDSTNRFFRVKDLGMFDTND